MRVCPGKDWVHTEDSNSFGAGANQMLGTVIGFSRADSSTVGDEEITANLEPGHAMVEWDDPETASGTATTAGGMYPIGSYGKVALAEVSKAVHMQHRKRNGQLEDGSGAGVGTDCIAPTPMPMEMEEEGETGLDDNTWVGHTS